MMERVAYKNFNSVVACLAQTEEEPTRETLLVGECMVNILAASIVKRKLARWDVRHIVTMLSFPEGIREQALNELILKGWIVPRRGAAKDIDGGDVPDYYVNTVAIEDISDVRETPAALYLESLGFPIHNIDLSELEEI
jgi:hypothetical protein